MVQSGKLASISKSIRTPGVGEKSSSFEESIFDRKSPNFNLTKQSEVLAKDPVKYKFLKEKYKK